MLLRLVLAATASAAVARAQCVNFGIANGDSCACPPGFSNADSKQCDIPNCGGNLYAPGGAAPGQLGNTSECACADDWTGRACTVCRSASACSSSLSKYNNAQSPSSGSPLGGAGVNSTMVCSNAPTVYAAAEMVCEVNQPTLQALYPGQAELTISRFLNASLTPGGTSALDDAKISHGDGEVWAQLWYRGIEQFYCHGTSCNQTITQTDGGNSSKWECTGLECKCRPNTDFCGAKNIPTAQDLSGAINGLKGPLTVDCGADGSSCQFQQMFLNTLFGAKGLTLTGCVFGECVEQHVIDQALGVLAAGATGGGKLSSGVIAGLAVVGAFLLAIILVVIWGLIRRSKARKVAADGSLEKRGYGVGVSWSGVGYEVQARGRGLYARTMGWLRGWNTPVSKSNKDQEGGAPVGPNGGRVVLRDTSGELAPGALCCILGPSGAGKSTLVDILAGKRKTGKVQGKVAYLEDEGRQVKVGYCDQSDVLSPTSTVLETLKFAAYLRLPENVPKKRKEERAMAVLRQLGLEHVAHTRVGSGEHRGISGGEMRRVSIGIELVANPDVLVLDEPTSGLDSVSATRIVSLLRSLAEEQRTTIIASIHQPSSALYHMFSQVLLLANGRQLYFGPGGAVPAEFFAKQGRPCPPGYNVADHLLDIASESNEGLLSGREAMLPASAREPSPGVKLEGSDEQHTSRGGSSAHLVEKNGAAAHQYPPGKTLGASTNEYDLAQMSEQNARAKHWWPVSRCATTFLTQVEVLGAREWRNLMRDKTLVLAHVVLSCIIGVFAGGLYFDVKITIAGFQNRVGSLFFLGALLSFTSLSALNNMLEMRPLFLRERAGSFYTPQAWLVTRFIFDIVPLRLIPTILVSVIVYFMVGLARDAGHFFKYLLIAVEYSFIMTVYNFLLGSVFTHPGVATLLSALYVLFNLVYAGFFINLENIPPVLRWLRYIAPLSYMLEALTVNEVGSGLMIVDTLQGVPISIGAVTIMYQLFGYNLDNYYPNVLKLAAFLIGFSGLLIVTVVYLLREKR